GCALCHFDRVLSVHRPADHRRTGVAPTIRAMTQRVGERLAFSLIADGPAMAAAGNHGLLPSSPNVEKSPGARLRTSARRARDIVRRRSPPGGGRAPARP